MSGDVSRAKAAKSRRDPHFPIAKGRQTHQSPPLYQGVNRLSHKKPRLGRGVAADGVCPRGARFRPLFGGGTPSPLRRILKDFYLQVGPSFVRPLLEFCAPFGGFFVMHRQVGNTMLSASICRLSDKCRHVEQTKSKLVEFLRIIILEGHGHYSRRNMACCLARNAKNTLFYHGRPA